MTTDLPHPEAHLHLEDGTAPIVRVTDAMLDHAAHEAAALADAVAHGSAAVDAAATRAIDAAAEASVDDAKQAADAVFRASDAAEEITRSASHAAEAAIDAARDGVSSTASALQDYGEKVIDIVQTNVAAASAHMSALLQAKSIPEAVSLNADHVRRQIETLTTQTRELAVLAQKAALDVFRPFRAAARRDD